MWTLLACFRPALFGFLGLARLFPRVCVLVMVSRMPAAKFPARERPTGAALAGNVRRPVDNGSTCGVVRTTCQVLDQAANVASGARMGLKSLAGNCLTLRPRSLRGRITVARQSAVPGERKPGRGLELKQSARGERPTPWPGDGAAEVSWEKRDVRAAVGRTPTQEPLRI